MRTLLRHTVTGLFFQGPEKWTDNPEKAFDFRFIDRALHYVKTWDLKDVELAFAFEDTDSICPSSLDRGELHYAAA
jgi:hypothetical protein